MSATLPLVWSMFYLNCLSSLNLEINIFFEATDILRSAHSVHSNQVKSWRRNGIRGNFLPLVTQVFKFLTLNKSYHCTILYFDTYITHKGIHMQNVSVELGVRQVNAVQRVFRSSTDVGIFDLIICSVGEHRNSSLEQMSKFLYKVHKISNLISYNRRQTV
jgi:hypothetical protein